MDDKSQRIFIKGAINTSSITPTPVASSNITPTSIVVVTVMAVTSNAVLNKAPSISMFIVLLLLGFGLHLASPFSPFLSFCFRVCPF